MGNRRRFKEFLRHQEATAAYKRALATASDNVQKFGSPAAHRPRPHTAMSTFRSSADGSILDVSHTHRSAHEETETGPAQRVPKTLPVRVSSTSVQPSPASKLHQSASNASHEYSALGFHTFSSGFEERYAKAFAKQMAVKAGLMPRTRWERENQDGSTLNPIFDFNHPLYESIEYKTERRKVIGRKTPKLGWQELERFISRQKEQLERKEDYLWQVQQSDLEKYKGLTPNPENRLSNHRLQECLKRIGPQGAQERKKEVLAKAEEKIISGLGFTPGGKNKKWNEYSESFYEFLERQQEVMRSRSILAQRPFGEYSRPERVANASEFEEEEEDD